MSNSNNILLYNKNKIYDIISCAICLEKFKHPRNLDCGHTFCTTCVQLIINTNTNTNTTPMCALCRNLINIVSVFNTHSNVVTTNSVILL